MGWENYPFDKVTVRGLNEVKKGSYADIKVWMAYESQEQSVRTEMKSYLKGKSW